MEKELTKNEERLLELQEKSNFKDLSSEEQLFVTAQMSNQQFDRLRAILLESKNIYVVPEPVALTLPQKQESPIKKLLIPLSSAAAAALITFFFFRKENTIVQTVEKPIYMASDTIYLREKQVDTVVKYQTVRIKDEESVSNYTTRVELTGNRASNEELQPISTIDLQNRGNSMRNDNTVVIMEGVSY